MRSYILLLLIVLSTLALTAEAGWFSKSSQEKSAAMKKKLAETEEKMSVNQAKAKASAKNYKAELEEQAAKAKKESAKAAKKAQMKSSSFLERKKYQIKNFFGFY